MPDRFVIKFVNSTWVIFDREHFCNCETFRSRKAAEVALRGG